jgi:hypothetical protein
MGYLWNNAQKTGGQSYCIRLSALTIGKRKKYNNYGIM